MRANDLAAFTVMSLLVAGCAAHPKALYVGLDSGILRMHLGEPAATANLGEGLTLLRYVVREQKSGGPEVPQRPGNTSNSGPYAIGLGVALIYALLNVYGVIHSDPELDDPYSQHPDINSFATLSFVEDEDGKIVFAYVESPIRGRHYRPRDEFGEEMLQRVLAFEKEIRENPVPIASPKPDPIETEGLLPKRRGFPTPAPGSGLPESAQ